jgi:putative transposase
MMDIKAATQSGAQKAPAARAIGMSVKTIERCTPDYGDDRRQGPKTSPSNALSKVERNRILELANSAEFRELAPSQIVPRLADAGIYAGSESTFYRTLKAEGLLAHRASSKPRVSRAPERHRVTEPHRLFSWDITYLRSPVRGEFFYLYLVEDVWSRKIVGFAIHKEELGAHSARLIERICAENAIDPDGLVLHSDNGGPMKGSTMLATLQRLGVVPSFSRPHVSDDNAFCESLFRTLKYRPGYPRAGFKSIEHAIEWVTSFVAWYNEEHRHSGIGFVTPGERHRGDDIELLAARRVLYAQARAAKPERWSREPRAWGRPEIVELNPEKAATNEVTDRAA